MRNTVDQIWKLKSMSYLVIILVSIIVSALLIYNYNVDKKESIANVKHQMILQDFNDKKKELYNFFRQVYVNTRTISLLPSVRSIKGGNRINEDEDVVAQGRFSEEGHRTVQQIYNNLNTIGASEIYAIVDGFNPQKGEVPFFMYDSLIIEGGVAAENGMDSLPADFPEEMEDEEYKLHVTQLDYFREKLSLFNIADLESIPAISSGPVRTCDNRQYLSRSHGDPVNTIGLLYSLPFYNLEGKFKGIISTILRLNVLEALLLDVPFLIITNRDKALAKKIGFEMPDKKGAFVLVNEQRHIFTGDRRNPELIQQIRKFKDTETVNRNDFYFEDLNIKGDTQWTLYFRYDQNAIGETAAWKTKVLFLSLSTVAVSTILLIGVAYAYEKRKKNVEEIEEAYEKLQNMTLELSLKNEEISKYSNEMEQIAEERSKQLVHADRMTTIGTLSAGVAHEIGNPVTFISNNLQIFERLWNRRIKASIEKANENSDDKNLSFALDEMPRMVREMREGTKRISNIVRNLLNFSRVKETAFEEESINECINNAVTFSKFDLSMKHNVDIKVNIPGDIPTIVMNKAEIEQVLINLFTNAVHAMEKTKGTRNPTLKISVSCADEELVIEVADNGAGMDEQHLKNIFNPFFTTKEVGKGTGLGLSISFGIIEKHRGTIKAASKKGEGATFTINLPLDPRKKERREEDEKIKGGMRNSDELPLG